MSLVAHLTPNNEPGFHLGFVTENIKVSGNKVFGLIHKFILFEMIKQKIYYTFPNFVGGGNSLQQCVPSLSKLEVHSISESPTAVPTLDGVSSFPNS